MKIVMKSVSYQYHENTNYALNNISVEIKSGTRVAILGPPGSGKSTIMLLLAGLIPPASGQVLYNGKEIQSAEDKHWLRNNVGVCLQQPEEQFFAASVWDEVQFAPLNLGIPKTEVRKAARHALEAAGLDPDVYGNRSPFELSGGERRRVALASMAVIKPNLILLDEPLSGLDQMTADTVWQAMKDISSQNRATCIVATHDVDWALDWADDLITVANGQISCSVRKNVAGHFDLGVGIPLPSLAKVAQSLRDAGWPLPLDSSSSAPAMAEAICTVLQGESDV